MILSMKYVTTFIIAITFTGCFADGPFEPPEEVSIETQSIKCVHNEGPDGPFATCQVNCNRVLTATLGDGFGSLQSSDTDAFVTAFDRASSENVLMMISCGGIPPAM